MLKSFARRVFSTIRLQLFLPPMENIVFYKAFEIDNLFVKENSPFSVEIAKPRRSSDN